MQRITISPDQLRASFLSLTSEQSHYLQRVLRLQPGDRFIVQDGYGHQWQATLGANALEANVVSQLEHWPQPPELELAAALPKQGFDDVVRQATELGVTRIQPVISHRTVLKPRSNKLQRWQRIVQEASEQCERGYVPAVESPRDFTAYLSEQAGSACYLCVARSNAPTLLTLIQAQLRRQPRQPVKLLVGPEGGWSPDEHRLAVQKGWQEISLGSGILRATTACLAALATVMQVREPLLQKAVSDREP